MPVPCLPQLLIPMGRHSMRQVARTLGLTTRTLRRRLDDEHENFSSMVDDVRTTSPERYLVGDRLSLTEISYQLGFAAPSAFLRWFRHRFGLHPTEWRQASRVVLPDTTETVPATRVPW
jgi:AraC-like DNA-binding protein